MKYILLNYGNEAGWPKLTKTGQEQWLGAYKAYVEVMAETGVLAGSYALQPTSGATTVRVADGRTQVLDGPYSDSKEQSRAASNCGHAGVKASMSTNFEILLGCNAIEGLLHG